MFKKKQITPWDIVKSLDQLKEQNGNQRVIVETSSGTVSLSLKDAIIYEGCCGEIVLDAE